MKKRDKLIAWAIVIVVAIAFAIRFSTKVDTIVPTIKEDSTLTKLDTLASDSIKVDTNGKK